MPVRLPHALRSQATPTPRRSLALRARVWASGTELDRRLAEGAAPRRSPELALRAEQLSSTRGRDALAAGLLRSVDAAAAPAGPHPAAALRERILDATGPLVALAREVRCAPAPRVRGLALVSWLLCDPGSPLNARGARAELNDVVARARATL